MGGLAPILPYLPVAKQGISLVSNAVSNEAAYRQQQQTQQNALANLRREQALNLKNATASADLQREQIATQSQADSDTRARALRRAVARQRASFGSSGVGNQAGGSGQAVLLGLFDEIQDELDNRAQLDTLRNRALDLGISNQKSLNVLQRTQLQERQNLGRLTSSVDRYSNIADSVLDAGSFAGSLFS